MTLLSCYLPEENLSQSQFNQLAKDKRVQLKFPYLFCLQEHKQTLEQTYNIIFFNATIALREMFTEEFSEELTDFINDSFDTGLMFRDSLRLLPINSCKNIDIYLSKARLLFLENVKYLVENYDTCNNEIFKFLKWTSNQK